MTRNLGQKCREQYKALYAAALYVYTLAENLLSGEW
jgi:hypothetical protein